MHEKLPPPKSESFLLLNETESKLQTRMVALVANVVQQFAPEIDRPSLQHYLTATTSDDQELFDLKNKYPIFFPRFLLELNFSLLPEEGDERLENGHKQITDATLPLLQERITILNNWPNSAINFLHDIAIIRGIALLYLEDASSVAIMEHAVIDTLGQMCTNEGINLPDRLRFLARMNRAAWNKSAQLITTLETVITNKTKEYFIQEQPETEVHPQITARRMNIASAKYLEGTRLFHSEIETFAKTDPSISELTTILLRAREGKLF